jgi:PAS domain-containing protein
MALFENEELYRAVVEGIADGIAIAVKTKRVLVNRAFPSIHGLREPSEVVGHPLGQFIIPEDRENSKRGGSLRGREVNLWTISSITGSRNPRRDTNGAGFGRDDHLQGTACHTGSPPGHYGYEARRNGDHKTQRRT